MNFKKIVSLIVVGTLATGILAGCGTTTENPEDKVYKIGMCQLVQHPALDPATAKKVLELSDKFICENNLTALMITHNMKDAITHGNRLIMMHEGRIIYDVSGEEKKNLTVDDLLKKFASLSGKEFANDRALLN